MASGSRLVLGDNTLPDIRSPDFVLEDVDKVISCLNTDLCLKSENSSSYASSVPFLENSATTDCEHSLLIDKSEPTDVPVSEDSKPEYIRQPVFIISTMENSNNAVDSVPLFTGNNTDTVFKLPITELSFNGTIKHVQKLKSIVDPISVLTSNALFLDEHLKDKSSEMSNGSIEGEIDKEKIMDTSKESSDMIQKTDESTGDSQYDEFNKKECGVPVQQKDEGNSKWNLEQSYSSLEASFDSGVRSPDMFSDDDNAGPPPKIEPFWSFLKDFEGYDKKRVKKIEETMHGVPPPPSITILRTDVTEMLKKYYCFLPAFTDNVHVCTKLDTITPTKRVSFIHIPNDNDHVTEPLQEAVDVSLKSIPSVEQLRNNSISRDNSKSELDTSADKSIDLKLCTESEARETAWPDVMKCRHYDVYYNTTRYSEKFEILAQRYGERYVGAETDTSVNLYSGGMQSPSSANKRKALRMKLAQAKSPGRRLSHLARRRQAFCSAATINEKAQSSGSKMVLIDKNFFPHRKLINSTERKSPRTRRTPGKKTPTRKTPGKKTPAKTPRSGSSRKKAMRRLLLDPEHVSAPRETMIKRALFISPENRKKVPPTTCSSVPLQAMKSKRALFGSPDRAETKSCDGTLSDNFPKRKRDMLDDEPETSRSKIPKSLSFGGDSFGTSSSQMNFSRRASEVFASRNSVELNETHKKKLLWAVSEALRVHGWRMHSPGFREKASALARLTRKLLALPPHAARLAAPKLSTSETMLKLARQYVFAIIQGRTVEECFLEEQAKISNDTNTKISGYISATAYQQMKARQSTNTTSKIKENCTDGPKQEQPKSNSKNILQDKLVNIDTNSCSSLSMLDKTGLFKSNSMPSFEEAAKMRARRQISFDNVDFPKR